MKHVISAAFAALLAGGLVCDCEDPPTRGPACIERAPRCGGKQLMCLCYDTGQCVWSCR